MDGLRRFFFAVLKIGLGLAVAILSIALVVWSIVEWRNARQAAADAPLAETKTWPTISLEPLDNATFVLATRWRDNSIQYRLDVDGYSARLAAGRENGRFTLRFFDDGGFAVFEHEIPIRTMTRTVNTEGEPTGLSWTDSQYLSADDYRLAARLKITWSGFPQTTEKEPSTATPVRPATSARPLWQDRARWRQLRVGMDEATVRQLLGEPTRVNRYGATLVSWHFGGVTDASVTFDRSGVSRWNEP
jgi:hypothetical protein